MPFGRVHDPGQHIVNRSGSGLEVNIGAGRPLSRPSTTSHTLPVVEPTLAVRRSIVGELDAGARTGGG
jgi:hypothetical protein